MEPLLKQMIVAMTWTAQESGTTKNLWGISFDDSVGIIVGDSATILLAKIDGTTSVEALPEIGLPNQFRLHENYPNPFSTRQRPSVLI